MTDVMLDMAEEQFLKRNTVSAFKWASLAQQLDPNFESVNHYVEAYRINLAALIIHTNGKCNWYKVLGIEQHSVSCQDITHQFVKLAKMIDPEVHSSSAAPKALKHVTMAWENLGEPDVLCLSRSRRSTVTTIGEATGDCFQEKKPIGDTAGNCFIEKMPSKVEF